MSEESEKKDEKHRCVNHPDIEAVARCALCGKHLCGNCFIDLAGKQVCPGCKPAVVGEFIFDKPARPVVRRRRNPVRASIDAVKRLIRSRKKEVHIDVDTVQHLSKMRKEQVFDEWFRQEDSHPERYGAEFKIEPKREIHASDWILFWGAVSLVFPPLAVVAVKKVLAYRNRERSDSDPEDADIKAVFGLLLAAAAPVVWIAGLLLYFLS